jgi:hypothetical protein
MSQYFSDPNYITEGGEPVLHFFGVANAIGDSAMSAVRAATTGAGGCWMGQIALIGKSYIDGAFGWTNNFLTGVDPLDKYNLTDYAAFFTSLAAHPTKIGWPSMCPGFNGSLTPTVAWSRGKDLPRDNGACWDARVQHT